MRRMEGDHGSIVAFRIPRRPSVGFHPSPSFAPSTTTADLHPLQLASSFRVSSPLGTPLSPRSPLCPSIRRAALRFAPSPSTLDRRACIAGVHASLRRPRPTDTRHQTLFSLLLPRRSISFSPSLSPFLLSPLVFARRGLSLPPSTLRFRPPAPPRFPDRCASRRRAKLAAQSRSVA